MKVKRIVLAGALALGVMSSFAARSRTTRAACASVPVSVSGELRTRLLRNFDRLEEDKYRPDKLFLDYKDSWGWPGDTEGRTILGLVCDARATGREPRYLQEILRIFPSKLNEKGYFGPVFDHANEQQLAGHGWVLRGLCEYRRWKNDRSVDPLIRGIVKNLFLPLEGDYGDYPIDPAVHSGPSGGEAGSNAARVGRWRLSTDVGCVFIGLDGLVQVRIDLDDVSLDPSIEALIGRFLAMDLVAARAQTHASLTAMRALLRWAEFSGRKDLIAAVESRFRTYVAQGMTENYENYNWFARFNSWTEPCGIVDSYIVADNLWRLLGKTEWRDLAELIYYNGLCRTQHANGGFGLDSTPGAAATNACVSVWCEEAHWCCTMRGAEGLAVVAESTAFVRGKELVLAYWRTADLEFGLPSGRLAMTIATDYPLDDKAVVKISAAPHTDTVLKLPFPAYLSAPRVKINDGEMKVAALNGFISLSRRWQPGDVVRISFCRTRRDEGLLNADQTIRNLPMRRFFGPLQIGVDESVGEERTLYHLMDSRVHGKGSGSLRIFFKKETSR